MSGWFRRFRPPPPPLVLVRVRRPSALFLFPCLFRVCPFRARCVVLVFALSLFSCVPLFASWLSSFSSHFHLHFIFIFISSALLRRGVCVDHLNRCKTSYMQGATLPVTREWPTKSLVSGTENVPAFAVHGRRRAQLGGNYIYIYLFIYLYVREPFLRLALWIQCEPGSFLCLAHWKQSHSCVYSCVWLFETKMNLGHSCVWPIGNKAILVSGFLEPQ